MQTTMCEKGILLITPIFIGTETETQRVQVACSKPQKWASLSLTRQPAYLQSLCTFTINKRTKTLNVQWNKRKNSTISHDDMEIFRLRSQIPDDKQFFRFIKDIYIYKIRMGQTTVNQKLPGIQTLVYTPLELGWLTYQPF